MSPRLRISLAPRGLPLCLLGAVTILVVAGDANGRRRKDDDRPWSKGEEEVVETRYPASFLDSLRTANRIGPNRGLRSGPKYPFRNRETLVYDGGWGFIPAGFAVLNAEPVEGAEGLMSLGAKGFTNNFVGAFKDVRDYVHTLVDTKGLYPLFFEQHIHEDDYRDHRWTIYDHETGRVFTHKKKAKADTVSQFTNDWLSLLYYMRTLSFAPGDTFTIMCYVHRRDYPLHFRVLERGEIKVDAGKFNCLKLEPTLVGEGRGFTKRDKMHIWVTDDKYHMPVMIKAKAKLGHVWARLLHYDRD